MKIPEGFSLAKSLFGTDEVGKILAKPTNVVIGQGESKVSFNVNVSAEGGGNPFSGQTPAQQKIILAKLIFGDNPKAIQLLEQLTDKLSLAGIGTADINIGDDGKFEITNLSKGDGPTSYLFRKYANLGEFMAANYKPGNAQSNETLMAIFKLLLETRSDVVKMIIEAMEKNHQLWMAMLKELAVKITKDKQEQKAIMQKLIAKLAVGDKEGAKGLVAFLNLAGLSVAIPPAKEDLFVIKLADMRAKGYLDEVIIELNNDYGLKAGEELLLDDNESALLDVALQNNDVKKARDILTAKNDAKEADLLYRLSLDIVPISVA